MIKKHAYFYRKGTIIRINPTFYPRWMCSVQGDYNLYSENDEILQKYDYKKQILEIQLNSISGIQEIYKHLL